MADAPGLEPGVAIRGGSSPSTGTNVEHAANMLKSGEYPGPRVTSSLQRGICESSHDFPMSGGTGIRSSLKSCRGYAPCGFDAHLIDHATMVFNGSTRAFQACGRGSNPRGRSNYAIMISIGM